MESGDRSPLPDPARRDRTALHGYPSPGSETMSPLLAYGKTLSKRRWTVLSVLAVILTVVLIATSREQPIYRATALIEIQTEDPNIVTVQKLFQLPNVSDEYLATQYRILRSDSLARAVIHRLQLDRTREFNPPNRSWPWSRHTGGNRPGNLIFHVDRAGEEAVLAHFEDRLSVQPIRGSRLVKVSFDSHNPRRAANVVNALTSAYIHSNLQNHWKATQEASQWLSRQLNTVKIRLEQSEDRLQQYVESNGLLFLETGTGKSQNIVEERLRQLQNELTNAQADLYQKESLYRLVQRGDYGALPGIFGNPETQALNAKLTDLQVRKAQLTPNFTASYPKMQEIQSQIDRIHKAIRQQQQQAARHIEDEYLAAVHREALVSHAFNEQERQGNLTAEKLVEYNILKRGVETNKQLYQGLLQRLREAGISAGLNAGNIRVVDAAVPPVNPVEPRVLLSVAIASLVGLTFGIGLAFLQERMDNSLKTLAEVESFLRVPALALIPSRRSLPSERNGRRKFRQENLHRGTKAQAEWSSQTTNGNGWIRVDSGPLEQSALSESFRSLRTSVLLSAATSPPRSIVVLSSEPGEGKTTICGNLAISLAQLGRRVLVVEADMRRPCLGAFFHLSEQTGVVHYLAGEKPWRVMVQRSGSNDLDCLVCGPVPPNPSELLSSERMRTLVSEALTEYDFVLIDSPPLLSVADGRILSTIAEGAILVAKGGATPRELVQRALLDLSDVRARLIGVVLNDVNLRRDSYGYPAYANYDEYNRRGSREKHA